MWSESSHFFTAEDMQNEFPGLFGYKKEEIPEVDRRQQPRIKDNIFIFCKAGSIGPEVIEGITSDIGSGGLCFDTTVRLAPGTEVSLEMYTPLDYHKRVLESMYITAHVAWCSPLEQGAGSNSHRVGLRFAAIAAADKERISRYVEDGFADRR
jgi:hypothetical protein